MMNEGTENMGMNVAPTGGKKKIIILLVIIVALVAGGWYYLSKRNADPAVVAQAELDDTIAAVGRLMILPEGDTPTLATVSDPEQLKGQPFFANAEVGDRVLVYPATKKVILYSPSRNKIIEVGTLNVTQ